jgi:hypothetical protein
MVSMYAKVVVDSVAVGPNGPSTVLEAKELVEGANTVKEKQCPFTPHTTMQLATMMRHLLPSA